jgi:tRNA A-37 threonylcarbamoyl transferase component Bud32
VQINDGHLTGTRVRYFGDYELLEEIARGGMGVVWKARQTSLKRDVALKMIRAGALAGRDEVARFLREAEAAANLQHPNIVAIHEAGEHGGQHYFTMDYVAGHDLGAMVKDGPLSPRVAARYVKIVAEAVQFAHQRGILHRDLKPQNVLIDTADQPRITDFGLAKITKEDSRLTQSGVIMGSPSYMPPEQAAGRHGDISSASDVYSLGAMLYELLTGRPPYRGATPMDTLLQVLEADPMAPRRLKADIPLDLETIALKCLEKAPSARYATARALAEELERFLEGEPIQARPASAVRKVVSWTRRHPGTLAALAALVLVALAFSVFYLFEENAFLRAQHADPALARVPGPRHESLPLWGAIGYLAAVAGIFLWLTVVRQARGLLWQQQVDLRHPFRNSPDLRKLTLRPLHQPTRNLAIGGSLILIGYGVLLVTILLQAHVWEAEPVLGNLGLIYVLVYFGLAILGLVIRDYRLVHFGIPAAQERASSRQLSGEEIEPIRRALEDHDWRAAIERYREAVPDANAWEAKKSVYRLFASLRVEHPEMFVVPPLSLATLNWRVMGICALIEAVILGALWGVMPPPHPASAVSQFAYSSLFGMGVIAGLRVKGLLKLVLLVPCLVVMILTETVVPALAAGSSHSMGLYLLGVLFGAVLMISAFTARSR